MRELTIDDLATGEESGRIDLCLLHGHIEDVYFAFECKRLNVNFPSGKKSLANQYVGNDGMGCFLSGKYSKGHEHGGMIGYVMDGDVSSATKAVSSQIKQEWKALLMSDDRGLSESSIVPNDSQIKQTVHYLADATLNLHHAFLPVLETPTFCVKNASVASGKVGLNNYITDKKIDTEFKHQSEVIAFQDHIEQKLDDNGDMFHIRPGEKINLTQWRLGWRKTEFPEAVQECFRHRGVSVTVWLDGHVTEIKETTGENIPRKWYTGK